MSSVVPEGWQSSSLASLANYKNGRAFKPLDWSRSGLPILRIAQINNPLNVEDYYEGNDIDDGHFVKKGDLIFSWSATLKAVIWSHYDAVLNQHIFKVTEKVGTDRSYLQQLLEYVIPRLAESSHGSTMKHIKKDVLNEFFAPVPPLLEQMKIASILTSVDEVIENTQKQIDKLQDLKKATMNELLTKGIGHTEFKDSELGQIPKSWEVYELGKLCAFTQGVQISLDETLRIEREGYIRYLYINDFSSEKNLRFIKDEFPAKIVKNEDLVMANTGHSAGTIFRGKHGVLSNNAFKISIKKYIKSEYLFHFLSTDNYWFNIGKLFNTAGQPHVGHGNIAKLHFLCPPLDEQDNINSIIQKIDQNILNKNIKLSQTQSLKKSLMQDLLTGKVRVTVN